MPANILNLPSCHITKITENEHDYHIEAESKEHPSSCQACSSREIAGFGRNEQLVRDLCMHGKQAGSL